MPVVMFAYVGPGAGLSAVGAFLALVGGVFLAVFGFLWYPAKRLLRTLRGDQETAETSSSSGSDSAES